MVEKKLNASCKLFNEIFSNRVLLASKNITISGLETRLVHKVLFISVHCFADYIISKCGNNKKRMLFTTCFADYMLDVSDCLMNLTLLIIIFGWK